jgi:hypothetical protein
MPGEAPKPDLIHMPDVPLSDATMAEQEEGRKAQQMATDRLKAEQEAGEKIVGRNQQSSIPPKPEAE